MNINYDIIIIGAGPGGYVAGIRAAQLGLKACVIEKDKPGGICLNEGCIPTKSLIHQAGIFESSAILRDWGVTVDTGGFDYTKVVQQSRKAADTLSRGVGYLLKKNNVPLYQGNARIVSQREIEIDDGTVLTGNNIIIATGSRPKELPGFECDGDSVITSTEAVSLTELPKKIVILGAGAIGCEFSSIMNAFGVEVILVEIMEHILPFEDIEAVTVLERSFRKKGITVMTDTHAVSMEKGHGNLLVTLEKKGSPRETVTADKLLVVIGRTPNITGFGLEQVGVKTENGFIEVSDHYQTSVPGIYAVGDVVASPLLAHVASREGEIAVEHIAGLNPVPSIDPLTIPSAVYTEPQIGSFGLTEKMAVEKGLSFKKAVFPYRGNGKAVATDMWDGLIKVIVNAETKDILGVHIAGSNASELIHEILLAKTAGLKPEHIIGTIHAHPTLSEMVIEVMRAVEGQALHL
ncbi:dihydrolipoyl dehydrogenase [Candidatus Omnitrophota bacterium]